MSTVASLRKWIMWSGRRFCVRVVITDKRALGTMSEISDNLLSLYYQAKQLENR